LAAALTNDLVEMRSEAEGRAQRLGFKRYLSVTAADIVILDEDRGFIGQKPSTSPRSHKSGQYCHEGKQTQPIGQSLSYCKGANLVPASSVGDGDSFKHDFKSYGPLEVSLKAQPQQEL
jgi:hypothetical protein